MKKPSAAQRESRDIKRINKIEAESWDNYYKDGDLRWLESVQRCILEKCKMLGIELPRSRQSIVLD